MKFVKQINFHFFLLSVIFPSIIALSGLTLIFVFVVIPYTDIKLSTLMDSPVVPGSLRSETGFSSFSFSEFKSETSSSFQVKDLPATFSISIPKLKIFNAKVETNSTNLDPKNILGHYRGTAIPGKLGNALIYGHSVLPYFFNPKDYKTIFSTLPKLEEKDRFYIDFSGKALTFEVATKRILKPGDVDIFDNSPLNLDEEVSTVTLMTCVPPGSKSYRILVIGKLID